MAAWQLSAFADEGGTTVAEQARALRDAGLRWIDLRTADGVNIADLPVLHAKEVKRQLDDAGVRVNMLGSPIGKTDVADDLQAELDRLDHMASLAPMLDCNAVRIFSFYNAKRSLPVAEFAAEATRRLDAVAERARQRGIVLYLENEVGVYGETVDAVTKIAERLRGPSLKLIFDFGNFHVARVDVAAAWRALADVTDALHLKDNRLDGKTVNHVPVGHGGGRLAEIVADAGRRGWSGRASVEAHLLKSDAWVEPDDPGVPPRRYRELPPAESFARACRAATDLLDAAGVAWS